MIKIRNLSKSFQGIKILDDLNLDVNPGETLVIFGKSGGGKSVLLKHIIGILKPDHGSITIGETLISELKGPDLYKAVLHMGMLFQGGALFDSMSVEDNIAFFLREHEDCTETEIETRVAEALETVGLGGTQKKMPSELSGGMRKRAALARLIIYKPSLILYDEPTTGLDPITSMQINELIVKLQNDLKATSVVVTHDVVSALSVGDRLALIDQGKIAHVDFPEAFMKIENPIIEFLRKTISQNPRKIEAHS